MDMFATPILSTDSESSLKTAIHDIFIKKCNDLDQPDVSHLKDRDSNKTQPKQKQNNREVFYFSTVCWNSTNLTAYVNSAYKTG